MNLPNGDRAIIPIEKLLDYCLNPEHSKGKHKARVLNLHWASRLIMWMN